MILKYKKRFRKLYKKLSEKDKDKIDEVLKIFKNNPFDERLRNHALAGKMEGMRSISAGFDMRLIFEVEGEYITVTMLKVGTHNHVY